MRLSSTVRFCASLEMAGTRFNTTPARSSAELPAAQTDSIRSSTGLLLDAEDGRLDDHEGGVRRHKRATVLRPSDGGTVDQHEVEVVVDALECPSQTLSASFVLTSVSLGQVTGRWQEPDGRGPQPEGTIIVLAVSGWLDARASPVPQNSPPEGSTPSEYVAFA
ncbi:MAG: hypothetical protein R2706_20825 [Acidimicrobiales bacterium]